MPVGAEHAEHVVVDPAVVFLHPLRLLFAHAANANDVAGPEAEPRVAALAAALAAAAAVAPCQCPLVVTAERETAAASATSQTGNEGSTPAGLEEGERAVGSGDEIQEHQHGIARLLLRSLRSSLRGESGLLHLKEKGKKKKKKKGRQGGPEKGNRDEG